MKECLVLVNDIRIKFIAIFQNVSQNVMVKIFHLQSVLGPGHSELGSL